MENTNSLDKNDQDRIESIKRILESAEKSLYSAKAMIAQLEGKVKPAVQKKTYGASPDGKVIEGVFDGQIMIGNDGKQYPVPANYASKSKLVEGDVLKLTITDEGNFIYKQIGPIDRKRVIGLVRENESGNYIIEAEGKAYKVLLASITYYKAEPGDEVTLILPKIGDPVWGAIDNILRKADQIETGYTDEIQDDPFIRNDLEVVSVEPQSLHVDDGSDEEEQTPAPASKDEEETPATVEPEKAKKRGRKPKNTSGTAVKKPRKQGKKVNGIIDEWTPEISEVEKEAGAMKEESKQLENEAKTGMTGSISIKVKNEDEEDGIVTEDFPDTPEETFNKK